MIYIDPPYNTGKDFIYKDNFRQDKQSYDAAQGATDAEGNRLEANLPSNGRFHSDWCSMIYSRLLVARELLTDDGVIFISIDENEVANLHKISDEIFGENNYVENFIWIKNSTKNLSNATSTNHEYILCYAKNKDILEGKNYFRVEKPGLCEVEKILEEANKNKLSPEEVEIKLKDFYKSRSDLKGIKQYHHVELRENSSGQKCYKAYRLSDVSVPKATGRADDYDVIHPVTGLPCQVPTRGWAYKKDTMDEHIKNNLVHFYEDHTKVPQFKRFLDTVTTEITKSTFEDFTDGKKELMKLFDGKAYFDNAKPTTVLKKFLSLTESDAIILDFFSGSATTAHAVMQLNAEDGGKRKFICVQLPEPCDPSSTAYQAGFANICEIGKERIRRAGAQIEAALAGDLTAPNSEKFSQNRGEKLDTGFRVFRLDSSNFEDVHKPAQATHQAELALLENNIKADRTGLDLFFASLLDWGVGIHDDYQTLKLGDAEVHLYHNGALAACFDPLTEDLIKQLAALNQQSPIERLVLLNTSFDRDDAFINCQTQLKTHLPNTEVKVI